MADGVTCISEDAFAYCENLTSATVPESVTNISYYAFSDCDSLTSITVKNPDGWISGVGSVNGVSYYALGDPAKVTITGYDGSTALDYAERYGYRFTYLPFTTAPTDIAVSSAAGGVKITWIKVYGASKYRVLYREMGSGTWKTAGETSGTSLTWTNYSHGVYYGFTVRCITADGKAYTSDYYDTLSFYSC